ncbi:hypothetical protein SKAU_G00419010 [Synaphobranchus kaupii]|uniref:Uncharacterized protein n=1 Tax=Synaphobranchus kaupii TaxID=118154 RepID=A0A9Q1E675_SYNKA|nr:hypothetical protein SKAU_G00419010 [Synaphobranchus kaupii]
MRAAIDGLLAKHHGAKDILKWVDADYAALVHSTCADPNSLLHPTTRQHISRPITVTTLPAAPVNPPALDSPMTQATVERMVKEILERQQCQQQQQQSQVKKTRSCLACGQPKSRYQGDGSSVHFFHQSGSVKYFYCSTKVFKTYAAEGLTDPRMSFQGLCYHCLLPARAGCCKAEGGRVEKGERRASKEKVCRAAAFWSPV